MTNPLKENGNKVVSEGPERDLESGKSAEAEGNDETTGKSSRWTRLCRKPVRTLLLRAVVMLSVIGVLLGLASIIWYYLGWTALIVIYLVTSVACAVLYLHRWLYVAAKTVTRDLRALYGYLRILMQASGYQKHDRTIAEIFQHNAQKYPTKPCVIFEDQEWSFAQVEEYSNKIANVFKSHGFKKGDIVALYMENRPEYVATWLGLAKLGVIIPLINTNLRQTSLIHSITIAKSQAIVFSDELSGAVKEVLDKIDSKVTFYNLSASKDSPQDGPFKNLTALVSDASSQPPSLTEKVHYNDHLVYIYTSGTTGLPKAAVITHARFVFIAAGMHWMGGFSTNDRFYTPLPLYHTAGGCMAVGQMLMYGSTLIIRKKFSASAYFPDIKKYNATVAQYIGEMCRYVLAVPPNDCDKDHNLKIIFGNGLRPQIWTEFVKRFNIPRVAEFYGATEGNANIVNTDNTVGAVGFISRIIPAVYPITIIKVDPENGDPIRNSKGFCMPCKPNEPGVFVGKITAGNPARQFLGYVDSEASKKKIVSNVFRKGDSAFISGDILIADEFGYLFFKDRTGDTFRWKGENVSTSEVEAILSNIVNYKDVIVYGVEVKGQEGRAGMAAILDPQDELNLSSLAENIKKQLPVYARPIFIRIMKKLDMTGTFKLKKVDLQREGFNPNDIKENIYYLDSNGNYALLTAESFDKINSGVIRL